MTANALLAERFVIEAAIAQLQPQAVTFQSVSWFPQIAGSFKDEPAFDALPAYG